MITLQWSKETLDQTYFPQYDLYYLRAYFQNFPNILELLQLDLLWLLPGDWD